MSQSDDCISLGKLRKEKRQLAVTRDMQMIASRLASIEMSLAYLVQQLSSLPMSTPPGLEQVSAISTNDDKHETRELSMADRMDRLEKVFVLVDFEKLEKAADYMCSHAIDSDEERSTNDSLRSSEKGGDMLDRCFCTLTSEQNAAKPPMDALDSALVQAHKSGHVIAPVASASTPRSLTTGSTEDPIDMPTTLRFDIFDSRVDASCQTEVAAAGEICEAQPGSVSDQNAPCSAAERTTDFWQKSLADTYVGRTIKLSPDNVDGGFTPTKVELIYKGKKRQGVVTKQDQIKVTCVEGDLASIIFIDDNGSCICEGNIEIGKLQDAEILGETECT